MKKILAACLLCLSAVFVNVAPASALMIGAEEMPDSMKKTR
ncbi:MAG: hypothetical protein Q4Q02_09600 [Clostridium sp.]|nr:hypothetical protein [Clostridium sp.]